MKSALKREPENAQLRDIIKKKDAQIQQQNTQIKNLQAALIELRKHRFGARSEKNPQQDSLFNEAEVLNASKPSKAKNKIHHKAARQPLPANLERVEQIHDAADQRCPNDGTPLRHIGEQVSEQLLYVPATFKVIRHRCYKYACPQCQQYVVTASKPVDPIPKSIATPELLSYLSVSKYADGLPLYRMVQMFKRLDININRTSMAFWMVRCGQLVQSLINLMTEQLHTHGCIHMDETTVQVLNEPGKKPSSKSYMWIQRSSTGSMPIVLFHYSPSRSANIPKALLGDYSGALVCDGYEAYESVCQQNHITRLGCWAHARRKFVQLLDVGEHPIARSMLELITQLYSIEKQAKDDQPKDRQLLREQHSIPILKQIRELLDNTLHTTTPTGAMGQALGYLDRQWCRLIGYTQNGVYPIDNNPAENAIRPFVIGRKNWLFSQSQQGAKASANLYSLVETAKANNLNPEKYLTKVYQQLPQATTVEDIEALLPWNIQLE